MSRDATSRMIWVPAGNRAKEPSEGAGLALTRSAPVLTVRGGRPPLSRRPYPSALRDIASLRASSGSWRHFGEVTEVGPTVAMPSVRFASWRGLQCPDCPSDPAP